MYIPGGFGLASRKKSHKIAHVAATDQQATAVSRVANQLGNPAHLAELAWRHFERRDPIAQCISFVHDLSSPLPDEAVSPMLVFPLHLAQSLKQVLLDPTSTIDQAESSIVRLSIP